MTFPNLAASARGLRGIRHALFVALLMLLSVGFGWVATTQGSNGGPVASWYPAAGINVIAALAVGRRYRLPVLALLAVLTFPVLYVGGRPLLVAIVGALGVALEAWIVTRFVLDADDQPRLTTTRDVGRFFVGTLIGSAALGLAATSAIAISGNLNEHFFSVVFSAMASHASAIIVIAPIALVNRRKKPMGRLWVRLTHAALLCAAIVLAFAPGSIAALAFLPIPLLAWAAFSFSMADALVELVISSALVVILTTAGGGPFQVSEVDWLHTSTLLELYVITLSATTMLIASARNERQILEEQKSATAQLLHRGFEQLQNGFMIVQEHEGFYSVMEANPAAIELMPLSVTPGRQLISGSPVHAVLDRMLKSGDRTATLVNDDDDGSGIPASLTVTVVNNSTFGEILLLTVVDLRATRAAEVAALLQLQREQSVVEELKQLNRQKDDFVASVTHELRTPITTVIGFSEELDDTPLDETQKNYVAIIQRNALRLLSVIEDVLTFSRRHPGADAIANRSAIDVTESLANVLDDLRHSIRSKDLTIETDLPELPVLVKADPNDLTRVIVNILTNAIKFSPAGGRLTITAHIDGADIVIALSDTGPGISSDDITRVFDRFYRASQASQDGVPGTGLGLSIVRELVEEMNGTIVLRSDGHSGTTALLTLPIAVGQESAEAERELTA